VAEINTPRPMDVVGRYFVYDELITRVSLAE